MPEHDVLAAAILRTGVLHCEPYRRYRLAAREAPHRREHTATRFRIDDWRRVCRMWRTPRVLLFTRRATNDAKLIFQSLYQGWERVGIRACDTRAAFVMTSVRIRASDGNHLVQFAVEADVERMVHVLQRDARRVFACDRSNDSMVVLINTTSNHYDALVPRGTGGGSTSFLPVLPVLVDEKPEYRGAPAPTARVKGDALECLSLVHEEDDVLSYNGLSDAETSRLDRVITLHARPVAPPRQLHGAERVARRDARVQYLRRAVRSWWACKLLIMRSTLNNLERVPEPRCVKLLVDQLAELRRWLALEPRVAHADNLTPPQSQYANDEVYCLLTDMLGIVLVIAGKRVAPRVNETQVDASTRQGAILPPCFLSVVRDGRRFNEPLLTLPRATAQPGHASGAEAERNALPPELGVLCSPFNADALRWRVSRAVRGTTHRRDVTDKLKAADDGNWITARLASGQLNFSRSEWTAHGVTGLLVQDILRVGDVTFEPTASTSQSALAPGWESFKHVAITPDGRCFYHAVARGLEDAPRFDIELYKRRPSDKRSLRVHGEPYGLTSAS